MRLIGSGPREDVWGAGRRHGGGACMAGRPPSSAQLPAGPANLGRGSRLALDKRGTGGIVQRTKPSSGQ
jgi:hypothetical protein